MLGTARINALGDNILGVPIVTNSGGSVGWQIMVPAANNSAATNFVCENRFVYANGVPTGIHMGGIWSVYDIYYLSDVQGPNSGYNQYTSSASFTNGGNAIVTDVYTNVGCFYRTNGLYSFEWGNLPSLNQIPTTSVVVFVSITGGWVTNNGVLQ